jgi:hypothetical protein
LLGVLVEAVVVFEGMLFVVVVVETYSVNHVLMMGSVCKLGEKGDSM